MNEMTVGKLIEILRTKDPNMKIIIAEAVVSFDGSESEDIIRPAIDAYETSFAGKHGDERAVLIF